MGIRRQSGGKLGAQRRQLAGQRVELQRKLTPGSLQGVELSVPREDGDARNLRYLLETAEKIDPQAVDKLKEQSR